MSRTETDPRVINFSGKVREGEKTSPKFPGWSHWKDGDATVKKIVLGVPPIGNERQPLRLSEPLPDFAKKFPKLTHLYLWQLEGPGEDWRPLSVPDTLQVLDARNCPGLDAIERLPAGLNTLVLDDCSELTVAPPVGRELPALEDLSLKGCAKLHGAWVQSLLSAASALRKFDASRCPQIEALRIWPDGLERIELQECPGLRVLPESWPKTLRRLGLNGVVGIDAIPELKSCSRLDYVDLQKTVRLRALPEFAVVPPTLLLYGSGIDIDPALLGSGPDQNVAADVRAHLQDIERGTSLNNDVIAILLGDGGSGKSAVLRRWLDDLYLGDGERSTHAIRLRTPAGDPIANLQIWDFAGQDLYHSTHRLFMRSDAVYLLCASPYGAGDNPKNDAKRQSQRDIVHGPKYWLDQIRAAGDPHRAAPVILIRTKKDRDAAERPELTPTAFWTKAHDIDLTQYPAIEFSAADPTIGGEHSVERLRKALIPAVEHVLGSKARRTVGPGYSTVRAALQVLKNKNDSERERAEKEQRPAKPAKPWMSLDEYKQLVSECVAEGIYRTHPELLLTRLNQQGFLYYDERYLKDTVILDQRWAIAGMYAALHREFVVPGIRQAGGIFTIDDLSGVWDQYDPETGTGPYSESEKQQILGFMQSAGLCFELREARDKRPAEYLLPEALPLFDEVAGDVRIRTGDAAQNGAPVVLSGPTLGAPAVLDLLVTLGRGWREALKLWHWGGLFRSYRFGRWDENPAFVKVDWSPETEGSFGGKLSLTVYGPDRGFLAGILDVCRSLPSFARVSIPPYTFEERMPPGRKGRRTDVGDGWEGSTDLATANLPASARSYAPAPAEAHPVRIGISFKGDAPEAASSKTWQNLPENSIEQWPWRLWEILHSHGFDVVDYRRETQKPTHQQLPGRGAIPNKLARLDYVIFFVGRDYLHSNWCMWEFWMVYSRMPGGVQNLGQTRLALFPEAHYSSKVSGMAIRDEAVSAWEAMAEETIGDATQRALQTVAKKPPSNLKSVLEGITGTISFYAWCDFAFREDNRTKLAQALFHDWTATFIQQTPSEPELKAWVNDIIETTEAATVLRDYALHEFATGDKDRATDLYDRAIKKDPKLAGQENLPAVGSELHELHLRWLGRRKLKGGGES